ncbi:MAG TPA: hypothetical protein VJ739_11995, partial [Gemmataceae bacterium]|nr:hypothetical protein [Gemmataceae bacterium]
EAARQVAPLDLLDHVPTDVQVPCHVVVSGRFKTSHSWALQNQPPLLGVSDTHLDCNGLGFMFKASVVVWPSLAA